MIRTIARSTGLAAALVLLGSPAYAHVTATPDIATSPSLRTAFRISHGCEGSPTTTVRIQIPEGLTSVTPEALPGWEVQVVRESLAEPVEGEDGEQITDRVSEIAWSGGSLPDGQFQEFGLNLSIADDAPEVLWFPTVQQCAEGETRWIDIPPSVEEWHDLDEPAPFVQVATDGASDQAASDDGASGQAAGEEAAASADAGSDDGDTVWLVVAVAAGLLGLVAGVAALVRTTRATGQP